jgi:hypothetical protein
MDVAFIFQFTGSLLRGWVSPASNWFLNKLLLLVIENRMMTLFRSPPKGRKTLSRVNPFGESVFNYATFNLTLEAQVLIPTASSRHFGASDFLFFHGYIIYLVYKDSLST